MNRALALVDGEHYPPTTRWGILTAQSLGYDVTACLFLGGIEKLGADRRLDLGDIPVLQGGDDPAQALRQALSELRPDAVLDLSDEPVMGYRERMLLVSVSLAAGVPYVGADFRLEPPVTAAPLIAPTLAVIGTGKRTGKTAVAGQAARVWREAGLDPVVVAMGRGGPPEPEVITAGELLDPVRLLEWSGQGRHAASDYIEDALTSGVPTVGAWRAGGGLAGATFFGNYDRALDQAKRLDPGLLLLEGSGAAIPPARADACVLIVNAGIDPEQLCGYFGLFRVLLADLVVLTMCEESTALRQLAAVEDCVRNRPAPSPEIVRTVFRPHPLGDVSGKRTWFATTAEKQATSVLKQHLEVAHGARIVGVSHALADRHQLRRDLEEAEGAQVLAVELKAAAVDVVTRFGVERGIEVVYVDNRAVAVGDGSVEERLLAVAAEAQERFAAGASGGSTDSRRCEG